MISLKTIIFNHKFGIFYQFVTVLIFHKKRQRLIQKNKSFTHVVDQINYKLASGNPRYEC